MAIETTEIESKQTINLKNSVGVKKSVVREWIEAIVIALILALIIRTFIVQAFKIPSGSMKQTLQIGDHILVNKFIYNFSEIERDDIVVFKFPKDETRDFIKRVVGLSGEKVELKNRVVYINDKLLQDGPHVFHAIKGGEYYYPRDNFGPVKIPEGKVFVMGDNRENSMDGRFWGLLDVEKIKGKAFIIYWSWNSEVFRPRWGRIGMLLR